MGDSNDRLKEARKKAGFRSARSAALRYGWTPSTYASHENGQTGTVPVDAAKEYADKFGVSQGWILTGENPPDFMPNDAELIRRVRQASAEKKAAIAVLLGIDQAERESAKPPASSRGRLPVKPK